MELPVDVHTSRLPAEESRVTVEFYVTTVKGVSKFASAEIPMWTLMAEGERRTCELSLRRNLLDLDISDVVHTVPVVYRDKNSSQVGVLQIQLYPKKTYNELLLDAEVTLSSPTLVNLRTSLQVIRYFEGKHPKKCVCITVPLRLIYRH